ncbi:MAG: thiamine pyrophosphate-binding protein [Elusimicrobiota bacterium]
MGLLLEYLKQEGVHAIFGIPGGSITPLYDALYHDRSIKTVSTRHEAGAAFMALGYARISGRIGACCLTTGPGSTNAITAVAAAKTDSVPMLVISAQVPTLAFGKGALQDSTYDRADIVDMLRPVTKMSAMLANPHNLAMTLRQCLRVAMSGRRGPVHLNIPADMMRQPVACELQWPQDYRPIPHSFDREAVKAAADYLLQARKPAILAGHGVNIACAQAELRELAELLSIPVATTPKGKGAFSERHPLSLRVFGLASSPQAERYLLHEGVDVLLVLGSSLHEVSTQAWEASLQPKTAFIQQDLDPTQIGRNYPVQVAMVGDAKTTLRELIFHIRRLLDIGEHTPQNDAAAFYRWKAGVPHVADSASMASEQRPLKPQRVMREINDALPPDAAIFVDVGNHTMWALHYLEATGRNTFIHNWGEFATMGYGIAAAIGGKLAAPKRPVVAIGGDGGFGMTGMEVSTAVTYGVPVVWVILNDGRFNAVHHGQMLQYAGRSFATEFHRMDLAKIAEGLGAQGVSVDAPGELTAALRAALASGKPTVIDVRIDPDEVPPIHSRVRALERFFTSTGA